ncbi:MAG: hypothetical protein ACRC0A_02530 [Chitinophagaceae bacterium]
MKQKNIISILYQIAENPCQNSPENLIDLIQSFNFANQKIFKTQSIEFLKLLKTESFHKPLSIYLSHLFVYYDNPSDYAEIGYTHNKGFFSELYTKIIQKILPPLNNEKSIRAIVRDLFFANRKIKTVFLNQSLFNVKQILQYIFKKEEDILLLNNQQYRLILINALPLLSIRIAAIGSEKFFLENNLSIIHHANVFQQLHTLITNYYHHILNQLPVEQDIDTIQYHIQQIKKLIHQIHDCKNTIGINSLFLLKATQDMTQRIEQIISILQAKSYKDYISHKAILIQKIIKEEASRYGISGFMSQEIQHISANIVEKTSIVGENYSTTTLSEYNTMFYKALKGGMIIGLFSSIKILISYVNFPPFVQGFLYGLNYAIAFVLLYHFHFILATKQPAYTAAKIAKALEKIDRNKKNYYQFIKEIMSITRAQFISIIGNISAAFPIAVLWSLLFAQIFGQPIATEEKAYHLIHNNYFISGGGMIYGAIAGFWLMVSGFISGYFDNLTLISKIPERIRKHPYLIRILSPQKIQKIAEYTQHNLGGIMGNTLLGFLLGLTATFGNFFGIPVDIRHIAFASANEGYAFITIFNNISIGAIIFSVLGVFGIGLMNVLVSFFLTIWIAMNTQSRKLSVYGYLVKVLFFYFLRHPLQFFYPLRGKKKPTS